MRALALVALCAALYGYRFGTSPPYIGGDEAHFGVQAHALAYTGRDFTGRTFPLFFNLADPAGDPSNQGTSKRWYQPTLFYLTAPILRVLPFSEASVRAPALLCGLLNVALLSVVAARIAPTRWSAWLAPALLIMTPAHLIFSRQATDYICPLPYVIGWLWCLVAATKRDSVRVSFLAGAILGLGFYSYIAAWILMPLLLVVYCVACRSWRHAAAVIAGFALFVVPLIPWLIAHPEMLRDTLGRYGSGQAAALSLTRILDRVAVYASYFDPWLLFLRGGVSPTTATARSGVFLIPIAILFPLGVYVLLRGPFPRATKVALIGGTLAAPIPAVLVGEAHMIQRALALVPFVVLISALGVHAMLTQPERRWRVVACVLLALSVLQFGYFYRDYLGEYERRAAFYFDPHAFSDVAAFVLAEDANRGVPAVYLSRQLDDASARWRFHLTKHGRVDLLDRTHYFDGDGLDLGAIERGSLIVMLSDGRMVKRLVATGVWSIASEIQNIDGADASTILRKVG
jgi:4-amino-4-deoxy-L-arabinose transferase-like glycosyltransferase